MPQIINTNIASLIAQRNLNNSQAAQGQALQRLSSGLRINGAADDAAGLAISTRFDTQIRGTSVAIRNANDAISLAQTAEGALASISSNLQRIRELAVQSANATNTDIDREALNDEVNQLVAEIQSVAEKTAFNGQKLIDGSFTAARFQTGANVGEAISVNINGATTDKMGSAATDGVSSQRTATSSALNGGDLIINGIAVGSSLGSDDALSTASKEMSAIAKAAAINKVADQTGVTATVNANEVGYTGVAATNGTVAAGDQLTINGVSISVSSDTNLDADTNREAVVNAINQKSAQTGVRAVNTGSVDTGITLVADDGRNIVFADSANGIAAAVGISAAGTYTGTFNLISDDGSDITLSTTNSDGLVNAGLQAGTFSGGNSVIVSRDNTTAALTTGDLVINGIAVGPSLSTDDTASTASASGSAIAKVAAINRLSDETGVTAKVLENSVFGGTITGDAAQTGSIVVNGSTIDLSKSAADSVSEVQQLVVDAINLRSGETGVSAEVFEDSFKLVAADGRNIVLAAGANQADFGFAAGIVTTNVGGFELSSAGKITLTTNNASNGINKAGLSTGIYASSEDGQLIKNVDISTVAGANKAITAVDNALQQVAKQQGTLGAIQNRFQSAISNLTINSENLSVANSRVKDADFAAETAELSRAQVLQQAGISILAQANARPQQVLSLLQ
ncbi:flagellin N-terminal helical domain-containing protein [Spartinivicinus ruber]|uniref:flagellin N-terminal helical domain-containing protein n=1 Tax=Spartinivicinus ruber TaxID=2683272 RepID=UPI0013D66830|nr:flagellin [Spartinivicinus ruber]